MKKSIVLLTVLAIVLSCAVACGKTEEVNSISEDYEPVSVEEKFWYAMGEDLFSYYSEYYASNYSDFDLDAFINGAIDYVDGTFLYSTAEMSQIATEYQTKLSEQETAEAAANLETAEKYLEENAKKDGVVVTESGLQYKIIKEGNGVRPSSIDTVEVNYIFSLADGTVVQDSHDTGSTSTLSLSSVIAGFAEGVQLMDVGSTYMFYIHPDLGYGSSAISSSIPGNSLLIYEVELVSIVE